VSRLRRALRSEGRVLLKLGIYTAGCIAVLFWLVSLIGNVQLFADRTSYEAVLTDTTGLVVNDEVKVAGVGVGKVTGISTDRGHAVVTFSIDSDVVLREGSQAGVRWRNVLGQKYLYLYPGEDGERMESGDRIPVEQSVDSADVGEFLNAVGPILQAIDPEDANAFVQAVVEGVQGNEAEIRSLLRNGGDLAQHLGGMDTEIGRIIGNMEDVVGALADRDAAVDATLRNLASLSSDLAARNDQLQQVIPDFANAQRQLDQLLRDNRGNLDATIANLEVIAATLAENQAGLEASLETLPEGLAPYHLISSYGQWFQVRSVITCLANQTSCAAEDPFTGTGTPLDAGQEPGGGTAAIVGFANSGGDTPTAGTEGPALPLNVGTP
jgi:phospholipid/cholesterol/gamma-HCH transport system substrate-binding protein